ncbi:3D (Asp-Asp-Asp) domain-containing protein [Planifilum fimeticola]|jgi:3D (Asp-Asp-Asp) domain-containing protein|uniref:3D (Asp-Asp-Asp) domain-containing protein n=1 Tax=Planifilum fimeticola TaxID=201975 RepID=A0A2T0LH78_9BACL|nr:3D domain-containing protein [Planifilum fimeticola]PRX41682.1 3D (Asp-Asp-Asp) domain-containing protein [Planifilum fimeticola]
MRKIALIALGVIVLLLSGTLAVYAMRKEVTVSFTDKEKPVKLQVLRGTLAEALEGHGYDVNQLKKQYISSVPWDQPISDDSVIQLTCNCSVSLEMGGKRVGTYKTKQLTVGDFLRERKVDLSPWDEVNTPLDERIKNNMLIVVDRVEKRIKKKVETVPYKTVKKKDPQLADGEEKVEKEGKKGKRIFEVIVTYKNGKSIDTAEKLIEEIDPVNKVVKVGTGENVTAAETTARAAAGRIAGHEYVKTMMAETTGYTHTGSRTATGTWPKRGTLAVDPRVIPLGTKIYIPGYGVGVAEDTGGAVKGNVIDLFFETRNEAIRWGRRNVTVYILKD